MRKDDWAKPPPDPGGDWITTELSSRLIFQSCRRVMLSPTFLEGSYYTSFEENSPKLSPGCVKQLKSSDINAVWWVLEERCQTNFSLNRRESAVLIGRSSRKLCFLCFLNLKSTLIFISLTSGKLERHFFCSPSRRMKLFGLRGSNEALDASEDECNAP